MMKSVAGIKTVFKPHANKFFKTLGKVVILFSSGHQEIIQAYAQGQPFLSSAQNLKWQSLPIHSYSATYTTKDTKK